MITIILLALKLDGVINSWFIVFLPMIITMFLFLLCAIVEFFKP